MTVECSHERVRAGDSDQDDPARRGYIDHIRQHIRVEGELTEEQRERTEYIAGRCPIHRMLMSTPNITDEVELTS